MMDRVAELVELEVQLEGRAGLCELRTFNIARIFGVVGVLALFLVRLVFFSYADGFANFSIISLVSYLIIRLGRIRPVVILIIELDYIRSRYRQGAQFLGDAIVILIYTTPVDFIGVLTAADHGLRAGGFHGHLFLVRVNQAGKGRLVLRQRGAVVGLGVGASGDGQLRRQDLQTTGTDEQLNAVVVVLREIRSSKANVIHVGTCILLCNGNIAQACRICFMRNACIGGIAGDRGTVDLVPNLLQIGLLIAVVTDLYIILNAFAGIGKACLFDFTIVPVVGPAVRLNTDRDVDRRYFQRAADVANAIVVRVVRTTDRRIFRRDDGLARIDAAIPSGVICSSIAVFNRRQGVAVQQALCLYLVRQTLRQRQGFTVILLRLIIDGYGRLFLIEEREDQSPVIRDFIGDLILRVRFRSAITRALDSLVEFPLGYRSMPQRQGLADLQDLGIRIVDRFTVHVDEVDGDRYALVAGIVECQNVLFLVCGKGQLLFGRIRIELFSRKLRMISIEARRYCSSRFNDTHGVTRNSSYGLFRSHGQTGTLFTVRDDVLDYVAGLIRLQDIDKGNDIVLFVAFECQCFSVGLRTITYHANCLLSNRIANLKVRIGDGLSRCHRLAILVHIANRIAQSLLRPVGVDRSVRRDLSIPVEQFSACCRGIPAVEDITILDGRSLKGTNLAVLRNVGLGSIDSRGVLTVDIGDRERRRGPFRIQYQIRRGHRGEGIRRRQTGIGIPAVEGIVAVHAALGRRGRPSIRRLIDVCIKLYILNRVQLRAAVVVVDLECISLVIEIKRIATILVVVICIPQNLLRVQTIAIRIIRLTVCFRFRISIIICIFQIIVDGMLGGITPVRIPRQGSSGSRQQIIVHDQLLCDITCTLSVLLPAAEITIIIITITRRPEGGNILSELNGNAICLSGRTAIRPYDIVSMPTLVISIEGQCERAQFIVHEQHGRTVRRDDDTGGGILRGICFPTPARDGRYAARLNRAADLGSAIPGVVVDIGRSRTRIVVLLEHVYDGVVDILARPIGIQRGIALNGHASSDPFGQFLVRIPTFEGVAVLRRSSGSKRN